MFGKKDNSDEDYIASVEEYRDECTDEHGMTYGNYNSEQSDIDAYSDAYARFNSYIGEGERLLWCGRSVKGAKLSERDSMEMLNYIPAVICVGLLFAYLPNFVRGGTATLMTGAFLAAVIFALMRMVKGRKREYAITNKRIMMYNHGNKSIAFDNIEGMFDIAFYASPRNIGYVKYKKPFTRQNSANQVKFDGIYAIENPAEVHRILVEAAEEIRKNK